MLPFIAAEYDIPLSDADVIDKVWVAMMVDGPLRKKGYKCNLNRFYGLMDCVVFELRYWCSKLFVTLNVSLESAYLAGSRVLRMKVGRQRMDADGDALTTTDPRITTEEEKALRAASCNAYAITTMMHAEGANLMRWKIVQSAWKFNRLWQGTSNKRLRHVKESMPWIQEQIRGGFYKVMKDIFSTIGSEGVLADIGFSLPREGARLPDDGQVNIENSMARLHAEYNCLLVGNRLYREAWMVWGWPARSVLMVHDDIGQDIMEELQEYYGLFLTLKRYVAEHPNTPWKAHLQRHLFQEVRCQQLIRIAQVCGWTVNDEVKAWLKKRWSRILQSQLAEDGFNREKRAASKQLTRTGREHLAFKTLIDSDAMSTSHHFDAPEPLEAAVPRSGKLGYDIFRSTWENFSVDTTGLVTYSQKTKWWSPGASRLSVPYMDLILLQDTQEGNKWLDVGDLWWSCFMQMKHDMLVRPPLFPVAEVDCGPTPWMLPLKHVSDSASIFWLMQKQEGTHWRLTALTGVVRTA